MFKQNLSSFIKSKTNWVSIVSIVCGVYGLLTGIVPLDSAFTYIEGGLLGLGVRDAIG
jgi:hypothetical protein